MLETYLELLREEVAFCGERIGKENRDRTGSLKREAYIDLLGAEAL
jgi:hypothetical protein